MKNKCTGLPILCLLMVLSSLGLVALTLATSTLSAQTTLPKADLALLPELAWKDAIEKTEAARLSPRLTTDQAARYRLWALADPPAPTRIPANGCGYEIARLGGHERETCHLPRYTVLVSDGGNAGVSVAPEAKRSAIRLDTLHALGKVGHLRCWIGNPSMQTTDLREA